MAKKDREAARYDPEKLRARCEEKLGAEPGSTKGLTFVVLRELVKERFPKLAHEITAMLRTGDHLVGERAPSSGKSDSERFTFAEAPVSAPSPRKAKIVQARDEACECTH